MSMNIDILKVYKIKDIEKIRLGKDYDGGYIIYDIERYDILISCGILDDISFEEAFIKKYKNIDCIAFDGTINKLPHNNSKIKFIKKNISYINSPNTTNLYNEINNYNNVFLKMDIEGHEVKWLLSQSTEILKKIKQLVIEFHYEDGKKIFTNEQKWKSIKKLNETHMLVHFHANNGGAGGGERAIEIVDGVRIPNTFECTYIRKNEIEEFTSN